MWDKKEVFAGVLTAGRVAKVAFDKAGVPAQVLYHNHANFVSTPATNCTECHASAPINGMERVR